MPPRLYAHEMAKPVHVRIGLNADKGEAIKAVREAKRPEHESGDNEQATQRDNPQPFIVGENLQEDRQHRQES